MNANKPAKRLTVYINPSLDSRIRKIAKLEERPLSSVAERAFRAYLSSPVSGRKGKQCQ